MLIGIFGDLDVDMYINMQIQSQSQENPNEPSRYYRFSSEPRCTSSI